MSIAALSHLSYGPAPQAPRPGRGRTPVATCALPIYTPSAIILPPRHRTRQGKLHNATNGPRSKAEHYRREPMAKAWALASRPQGMPAEANFELIDLPQRALADGEVRIANRWLSVDPYMRGRMNDVKSYVQIGRAHV